MHDTEFYKVGSLYAADGLQVHNFSFLHKSEVVSHPYNIIFGFRYLYWLTLENMHEWG